jgi:hypothetical protein
MTIRWHLIILALVTLPLVACANAAGPASAQAVQSVPTRGESGGGGGNMGGY